MDFSKASLTNGFTGNLQMFGLGSGIDTQSIINAELQSMQLTMQPNITNQNNYMAEKQIWSTFQTNMNKVKAAVDALKDISNTNQSVTYSQNGFVNVVASGSALSGTYSLDVQQLAQAAKVMSDVQTNTTNPLGRSGTLNINGTSVSITSNMALGDVAKAINNTSGAGVDATVISGHLFLTSKTTGATSAINITATNDEKSATLSDNTSMGVTVTGDISTLNPSYQIGVQQLAQAEKVQSNPYLNQTTNMNYSGSFIINGQTVNIDTTMKMSDIVNAINNTANTGVTASIQNNQLVFQSNSTGANNTISLIDNTSSLSQTGGLFQNIGMTDSTGAFTNVVTQAQDAKYTIDGTAYTSSTNTSNDLSGLQLNFNAVTTTDDTLTIQNGGDIATDLGLITGTNTIKNQVQTGQDAKYTINGISGTSSTNAVTNAVSGMTFNLLQPTTSTVQVTAQENQDAIATNVQAFVDAYNQTMQYINGLIGKGGALQGNSLAMSAKQTLHSMLYDSTNSMMMFQIGIQGDSVAKDGTIVFNKTKLTDAMNNNFQGVMNFLTGASGEASTISNRIDLYTKSGGNIDNQMQGLDKNINRLQNLIDNQQKQFDNEKQALIDKYTKFESLMSQLNSQLSMMKAELNAQNSKN